MELLAPAGGFEQLRAAVHFGADAVYLGGERFGLRKRADNFSDADLPAAVAYAHEHGAKVHVTVNSLMHEGDLLGEGETGSGPGHRGLQGGSAGSGSADTLAGYLHLVEDAGADAVIAGDLATIAIARRETPGLAVHASTQLSCANHEAALVLQQLGASRIVLARELSIEEIAAIRRRTPGDLELEAFVHGAMCMAISGRCIISNHLAGRDANRGHCTQPCRWMYTLEEEKRPSVHFPVVEGERGTAIMSSKDLMMLDHLDDLRDAGIDSIKIEGRVKGAYYVATVVNAYRHVLDGAPAEEFLPELDAVSHRSYHTGFFYGLPDQTGAEIEYEQTRILGAVVEGCEPADGGWRMRFGVRNRIESGTEVEVLSPGMPVRRFVMRGIYYIEGAEYVSVADRAAEEYSCPIPFEVSPGDIIRRAIEPKERRCG